MQVTVTESLPDALPPEDDDQTDVVPTMENDPPDAMLPEEDDPPEGDDLTDIE